VAVPVAIADPLWVFCVGPGLGLVTVRDACEAGVCLAAADDEAPFISPAEVGAVIN
jgi:hypothetical protein